MRRYSLRLKTTKEVIHSILRETYEEALIYFCKRKKLSHKDLLNIFLITEENS